MNKIKQKSKVFYIVFGIIDVLLLLAMAFLLAATLIFSNGSAPSLFGYNIFLVETDAFSLVKKGSALIAEQVTPDEINPGNIIIFNDEEDMARVGEVLEVKDDDGICILTVRNDNGSELSVGQSHVVGKGIYYSEIIGMIISFAVSPAGVCLIAILPCAAFVIFEIIGAIRRRAPQPEVETVKKQDEVPTYVPDGLSRRSVGDELDITVGDDRPVFSSERQKLVKAAGLFTQPQKKSEQPKAQERAPISERDIDKLIKETKQKHELEAFREIISDEDRKRKASAPRAEAPVTASAPKKEEELPTERTEKVSAEPKVLPEQDEDVKRYIPEETVKKYEPRKSAAKLAPRVSRLDSLLQEDSGDTHYDIDDILKSLEPKEK